MTDCIHLSGLTVETIIGILSHELENKQPVVIDLKLFTPFSKAAASDDINDAVDYQKLSEGLLDYVANSQFHLLEKLADEIAQWLFKHFPLEKVQISVNKPRALTYANVGVSIERQKT